MSAAVCPEKTSSPCKLADDEVLYVYFAGGRCIPPRILLSPRWRRISLSFMRLFWLATPLRRLSAAEPPPLQYTPHNAPYSFYTQLYTYTPLSICTKWRHACRFPFFEATHGRAGALWEDGNAVAGGVSSHLYHSSSKCQRRRIFIQSNKTPRAGALSLTREGVSASRVCRFSVSEVVKRPCNLFAFICHPRHIDKNGTLFSPPCCPESYCFVYSILLFDVGKKATLHFWWFSRKFS